jgi:outer membrane immunogenic protein
MKKLLLAGIAAAAIYGAPALAADMAVKAPPPAPVVTTNWTGLYFDADIGYEWSSYNWTWTSPPPSPFSQSQSSGAMGGHIGYQQQLGWLVVGGEWGASALINKQRATTTSVGVLTAPCGTSFAGQQCQDLIGDVVTAGGKLGVDWGNWLVYGVGGWARGVVRSQLESANPLNVDTTNGPRYSGWYAGGGFDYMFARTRLLDFIAGVEYEHVDLGSQLQQSSLGNNNNRTVSATEDIVWAKLTVKFNLLAP